MAEPISPQAAEHIYRRFVRNVRRARRLASHARAVQSGEPDAAADVHRAAVVFLHAALEDVLRSVGRIRLPTSGPDTLAMIPLHGMAGMGDDRRFTLRHLAQHRGLTVDDLIYQSAKAYLDRKSFSNVQDVIDFLRRIDLDDKVLPDHWAGVARLMARRHRIVHNADILGDQMTPHDLTEAEVAEIESWASAVTDLGASTVLIATADADRAAVRSTLDAIEREVS